MGSSQSGEDAARAEDEASCKNEMSKLQSTDPEPVLPLDPQSWHGDGNAVYISVICVNTAFKDRVYNDYQLKDLTAQEKRMVPNVLAFPMLQGMPHAPLVELVMQDAEGAQKMYKIDQRVQTMLAQMSVQARVEEVFEKVV